jgi:hypothetical protein
MIINFNFFQFHYILKINLHIKFHINFDFNYIRMVIIVIN